MIGNAFHFAVAKTLRDRIRSDWQWAQIVDGKVSDIHMAEKLKALGAWQGWPDFALTSPTQQLHCLELKHVGEGLTEEQHEFRYRCGTPYAIERLR